MKEFLTITFSPAMLPFTILLILVILYWIFTMIGAVGVDFLSFDFMDETADGAAEGMMEGGGGILQGLLSFLNVGAVPVTVVGSLTILQMWFLAFLYFAYVVPALSGFAPFLLLAAVGIGIALVCGLLLTGLTSRPFRNMFKVETQHGQHHLIGQVCIIKTSCVTESFGQAEVTTPGAPLLLSVFCDEENNLAKGDEAVIVGYNEARGIYHVKPMM